MGTKWHVVVNPAAGRKTIPTRVIRSALDAAGVDATIEMPLSEAETRIAITEAVNSGATHLAVAGGDGTVNLAANAILNGEGREPPVLGVLPTGTGCDLLRTFGIPQDLVGAARHLVTEDVYPIDVATLEGEWGSKHFVNVAQIGVGAAAAETAARMSRSMGASRYPVAFLARLPRFSATRVSIETERRSYTSNALAVIMANAQFFAGGWNVAPKATLVDGILDMQIIDTKKIRAPALVPKVVKGTHLLDGAVRRFGAASFQIDTEVRWPLEADGDFIGYTPVRGEVKPGALRLKI